jgi:hypothetical protein
LTPVECQCLDTFIPIERTVEETPNALSSLWSDNRNDVNDAEATTERVPSNKTIGREIDFLGYSAGEHGELLSLISATLNSFNAIESSLAAQQKILGVYQQTGAAPLAIYHLAGHFVDSDPSELR